MSEDLTRKIERALADLEEYAPPAPAFRDIRAGGPVPLTNRPPRGWSNTAILVAAAAVTVFVVGIAALLAANLGTSPTATDPTTSTTSTTTSPADPVAALVGTWTISSASVNGSTTAIDAAAIIDRGFRPPQITVSGTRIEGFTGCNVFSRGPIGMADGLLTIGSGGDMTAADCPEDQGDLIAAQEAIDSMLFSGEVQIGLELTDETMTWSADDTSLSFVRSDPRALAILPSWPTSVGRLDCGSDAALTIDVPGEGLDAATVLELVPGVVSVEGEGVLGSEDPYAWGLDESGTVIAGTAPGDIQPPVFHLSACGPSFGMRPGADLTGAVATWLNKLGLAQTSSLVWSDRFVELCTSTPDSQLRPFANRLANEDAGLSLRVDGSSPTPDEARGALGIIRAMTCQPDPAESTTTTSTAPSTTVVVGTECSALGADGPVVPESFEGLPEPVAEARARLIDLARACDFEALVALAQTAATSSFDDAIFWGAAQSVETLRDYDDEYGSLGRVVVALTTVPWQSHDGERIDPESGETVPDTYYSWPPRAEIPAGGSLSEVWDADLLAAIAALNDSTVSDLVGTTDVFGAYAGFRVGIGADGRWAFALSGD